MLRGIAFSLLTVTILAGCADFHYTRGDIASRQGDYEKAHSQYLTAANQGDPNAQNALGILYLQGKGVKHSNAKAYVWFKRAAENGSGHGQYNLGKMYYFGLAVPRDRAAAKRWYEKAGNSGQLTGTAFRTAYVTTPDGYRRPAKESDFPYYSQTPNPSLDIRLGLLARKRGDYKSAYSYFLIAANESSPVAQNSIGIMFQHGKGVIQDASKAAQWYTRAAQGEYAPAQYNLGKLYYFGWGVPRNEAMARYWFQQAHSLDSLLGSKNQPVIITTSDGFERPATKADFPYYSETREAKIARSKRRTTSRARPAPSTPKLGVLGDNATETFGDWAGKKGSAKGPVASPNVTKKPRPSRQVAKRELSPPEVFKKAEISVYQIVTGKSLKHVLKKDFLGYGSAVAISKYRAFTNCHVLAGAGVAFIFRDHSKKIGLVRIRERDLSTDRCVISTDILLKPVKEIQPWKDIVPGQRVYAIGNPRGETNTISEGIVSGLRKRGGVRLVQTTAPISPGSSGGGLFDSKGRLVGITTMFKKESQNLNYAIAAEDFLSIGK